VSTRAQTLRGGSFLAARQLASLVLGLAGTIALTRLLGPSGYGRFAAALALYTYLFGVAQLGINAWLVRREDLTDGFNPERVFATARGLLLLTGVIAMGFGALLLPLVERWLGGAGVRPLALALLAGLPIHLMMLVPLAALERGLKFREVAATELLGLLLMYGVSVGLAAAGWGPKAMVIGWWLQQLWLLLRLQMLSGIGFAFRFDGDIARRALGYGLSYASSIWTWQLRELVNPLVVGRWLGVEGVALVALSIRLVDAASFVKAATWRLALPALARLQREPARLAAAVRDGMRLQLLTVGPALLLLALLGPMVITALFGERWVGVGPLLPLIAAGTLANAMFNLHSSALYAMGRNVQVTLFHLLHVVLFAGTARVLVPLVGVGGYGFAELVALPAYFVVYGALERATRATRVGEGGSATGQGASASAVGSASTPTSIVPSPSGELLLGWCLVIAVAGTAWSPWFALLVLVPALNAGVRTGAWATMVDVRSALSARSAA
jgi:O-antigen/teichoic acid export membrane protein